MGSPLPASNPGNPPEHAPPTPRFSNKYHSCNYSCTPEFNSNNRSQANASAKEKKFGGGDESPGRKTLASLRVYS